MQSMAVTRVISATSGALGAGLAFVPHPVAQGVSKGLGVVSAATGGASFAYETNPEKIMLLKK